jgi:hypothetical protein
MTAGQPMATDENVEPQTIRERLQRLRIMCPRKRGLQIYAKAADTRTPTKRAMLYTYIRSSDNTYAVHETVFNKKEKMTPREWEEFFREQVFRGTGSDDDPPYLRDGVLLGAIIPGTNIKSSNQWDVRAIIGFRTYDLYKRRDTPLAKKRGKTKRKRQQVGQNHIRRGHRNGTRKAK